MANVLVERSYLEDIADSIRGKLGVADTYKPSEMSDAIDSISGGGITPTGTINISANGTHDVTQYASAAVAVPNSYTASDEGKVVNNGALVSQTSDTCTVNGTVDTTLINSLTVNVSGGGGGQIATGEYTPSQVYDSQTVKITDISTIGFTPKIFILALDNSADAIGTQYAMITTVYYQIGSASDNYRLSVRYSNTSGGIQSNVYSKTSWTQDSASLLKFSDGDISFHSSAGYKFVNLKYVWWAFA